MSFWRNQRCLLEARLAVPCRVMFQDLSLYSPLPLRGERQGQEWEKQLVTIQEKWLQEKWHLLCINKSPEGSRKSNPHRKEAIHGNIKPKAVFSAR